MVRSNQPGCGRHHSRSQRPEVPTRRRIGDSLSRANPISGGFDGVFWQFDELRTKPRWELARELVGVRIE